MAIHPGSAVGIEVGTVVGETYEITRCIGTGGMGAVWQANHLRLPGKQVAIKVLLADIASDTESLARFRREAEIASKLGHPNIIQIIDFNTLPDGSPYLVLELLLGESLDQRLARGPLSVSETIALVRQIGSGLSAAHRENVVHRDLKPQNIFLCPTEMGGDIATQLKILDFGISKIRGSQTIKTQESTILGTPQYMAPEQATGAHKDVDATTDVFALGAMVYEMLAGQPAFGGQSVPEVVFKVVYEQPPSLAELVPGLPTNVVAAVNKALAKQQDERFAGVSEFVEAFTGRPLGSLRGSMPSPVATPPAKKLATAETHAADSEALAHTMHSGNRPSPELPMPSAADVVGDTAKKNKAAAEQALARTVATDNATLAVAPPANKRSRSGLLAVLAALVVGGGAAAFALTRGGENHTDPAEPVAQVPATKPEVDNSEVDRPVPVPEVVAKPEPVPEVVAKPEPVAKKDRPTRDKPPAQRKSREVDSPLIEQAQTALDDGNPREAVRLAKKALRGVKGKFLVGRAAAIVAVGYCMQQDLGNVRAWLGKVPRRARKRVLRQCRKAGVDLP